MKERMRGLNPRSAVRELEPQGTGTGSHSKLSGPRSMAADEVISSPDSSTSDLKTVMLSSKDKADTT